LAAWSLPASEGAHFRGWMIQLTGLRVGNFSDRGWGDSKIADNVGGIPQGVAPGVPRPVVSDSLLNTASSKKSVPSESDDDASEGSSTDSVELKAD
jgi:hypothetical protein